MKKRLNSVFSLVLLLSMVFFLISCSKVVDNQSIQSDNGKSEIVSESGDLEVHFIDVGQADSIFIRNKDVCMLIDAGNNDDGDLVVNYLRRQGVKRLDYVVGTHPHEDHIGGLDVVINNFDIGKVYMPKIIHNTKTFKDVVLAVKNKGLKITPPVVGEKFKLGDAEGIILAPNSKKYEDLNNYSIVIKVTYKDTSYLFTGDAEDISEREMIKRGLDLSADVLKLGHHGSHSSTTDEFLNRVKPKFAVIMCGKGNDYGHPHRETMEKLKKMGIPVYRTDECGTIVSISDGKDIKFNVKSGSYSYPAQSKEKLYKNNFKNTKKYTASNSINISANIDNPNSEQGSTINLIVNGPSKGKVRAVAHYKSKNTKYTSVIDSSGRAVIPMKIGRAAKGFKVIVDVVVNYKGKEYKTNTSFTPK
ncbi:ComEC/Rec2 family competence protein [Caminicella sporogenes]|uniref:ComEC/Rec2 family competence protein n=1 Tax=Caminicella sporogenes TaxID=166485 RepID=UPI002540F9D6|nr:ComEC/Rec2 family competence protein [Caminicella sporogenes]WIF93991.1 ComEC/Rec2 family competence protein [Caminicella sporogenes]